MSKTYLLFHNLPYDYLRDLPLQINDTVTLELPPFDLLNNAPRDYTEDEHRGIINFLLPGYGLPGSGCNNCCLSITSNVRNGDNNLNGVILFTIITALRLCKPAKINIAGRFTCSDHDDPFQSKMYYGLRSSWWSRDALNYSADDFIIAGRIGELISSLENAGFSRLMSAFTLFSQLTNGLIQSFQIAYLAMFITLETLFRPFGNKAEILSTRVSRFLERFVDQNIFKEWLKNEYVNYRNQIAHGGYSVEPGSILREENITRYSKLHEATRLCILGFLSMNRESMRDLLLATGGRSRNAFDALSPAMGTYVDGQTLYNL